MIKNLKKRKVKVAVIIFVSLILFTNYCFAGVADSKLATGTMNILKDVSNWLLIIAPILTAVFVGYYLLRKTAGDEMDAKKWDNRIKIAIICCIGVFIASGLITTITNYYK